jgi:nicotinamidase-related amidase
MADFRILPERTCLIIVDMINAFLKPHSRLEVAGGRELIPRLSRLLEACRQAEIPVIFLKMAFRSDRADVGVHVAFRPEMADQDILVEGTEDVEFYDGIKPGSGDIVIVKRRFSAFAGTDLDLILRSRGIDTLIIGGVATNICCESTARDARMKDYKVIFLSDGNAPMTFPDMGWGKISAEEIQKVVLTTMAFAFAQVLPVEEVIRRISSGRHKEV